MESIFGDIQASFKERVVIEASERHRIIQKYVILDDIDRESFEGTANRDVMCFLY